ncbi:MAG: aquaporin family protein [Thermoplasmata archaeon]|nr:aquaporin family protein [Thermoplasmata archaeon]
MRSPVLRTLLAEAAGTALLVGIGTAAIVEGARLGGVAQWALAIAWFAAVLVPMLLFFELSGAHLNPAVTLALAASGRMGWRDVPAYVLGQLGGAFLASAIVWAAFGDRAHLGATLPGQGGVIAAFGVEVVGTVALVIAVFAIADHGAGARRWRLLLPPTVVGLATYLIGPVSGSSLNPARTIAPAVFSGTYTDLWVYLLAVPLGALVGAVSWNRWKLGRNPAPSAPPG